ncbi:MAG: UvrD-helicase domain-containing protein [Gammaproteobacteria bacterium]|nr:UvrD-helicase domain-containing protein [Gammaproteobacteria bacterium]
MLSEPALIEADSRARAQALDVTRSFIVQAPAGSGKTELLIQRYLRLLATVDNPEEVLAITFTRKAAREMQQRVAKSLQQAKAGAVAQFAHEQITLDAAIAVMARDAALGWHLIETPRRMRIQTLDSLCAGIARLLPLSSGIGGISTTVVDAEAKSIYRSAAVATLDWLLGNDARNAAVENVLSHLDNNTGVYVTYVSRMLETRDQWLMITGSGQVEDAAAVRKLLEQNIADVVQQHLSKTRQRLLRNDVDGLPALVSYAASTLRDCGKNEHVAAILSGLEKIPGNAAEDLAKWRGIASLLLTKPGTWRKTITKADGFPTGDDGQKKAWMQLIGDLSSDHVLLSALHRVRLLPEPRYDDQQWDVLLSLLTLLPLAVTELKRMFSEQGVIDHVEVAQAAEVALGDPDEPGEIALMLDYRIRHLLLDEMQDTSIGQYRLLERLTAGWQATDGRTLFCVGDPMQSIYRFRNAEVGQFVLAREAGVSGLPLESLTLRQNFRSAERLVHWFNTVFAQIFPERDDIGSGAVRYSESVPVPSLHASGDCKVHALFNASAAVEALTTVEVIRECLTTPVEQDVVVLVRSRTQLKLLLAELRRNAIDYHAREIDRLTDLPEIIDLLALTRAFCHLGDRTAWLGLLRGPLVGLTWTDLHRLVFNAKGDTVWSLLQDESRLASLSQDAQTLLAAFIPVLQRCFAPNRVQSLRLRIESSWHLLGGPGHIQTREHLDNVYRFFDVLEKLETAGTLADPAELEQRLDDERVSSQVNELCRLQVMTIHKAKGLEFDHVILPSLGRATSTNKKAVLSWLNVPGDSGASDMIISPVGPSAELENDPLHQYIEARLQDSDRLEMDRLLYVACTRAKKSLHLIGHVNTSPDGADMRLPNAGSLLYRLWPALEATFAKAFAQYDDEGAATEIDDSEGYLIAPLQRSAQDWAMPRPPELPASYTDHRDRPDIQDKPVEFYWVGTAARHAGTIVHRWLHAFVEARRLPDAAQLSATDSTTRLWAQDLHVASDDLGFVCERVREALSGILQDPQGRWILEGEGRAELALTGLWQNHVESIIIDRVRVDDHGVHWIIDYKTSTHEGGGLDEFLSHETERYRQQLQKYVAIYRHYEDVSVKAALYFPLLQQFREVSVSGEPASSSGHSKG